jgi:endonuclease/exonuclease/phosphatase family metal-dependent hydrolase
VLALLVILAGTAWHASRRVPTGSATGTAISGKTIPASSSVRTIRIGTWNIHGGTGVDDHRDLGRTASCLRELDIAALNEVHGAWLWQRADQAELLGRQLQLGWLFAPAVRQWYHYDFGNALLTRLPVTQWRRIPLAESDGDPRNLLLADIDWGPRTLHVLLTHATRRKSRQRHAQIEAAFAMFIAQSEPAILLGDLNTDLTDPRLRKLWATPGVTDPIAALRGLDTWRIDWIFLRGLKAVKAGMIDQGGSDHPVVWAEVALPQ